MVSVNVTLLHEQDFEIRQKYGFAEERRNKELRLCDEVIEQGGILIQENGTSTIQHEQILGELHCGCILA
jgi:hypothetical protein